MLKLPLLLLLLAGTCTAQSQNQSPAQDQPAAQSPAPPPAPSPNPPSLAELQTTARILLVFSPDANSPGVRRQLDFLQRHSFELANRNTVFVPISTASKYREEKYAFESVPLESPAEQAAARARFHVQPGDFVVILIDENGTQQIRSATPVDIHALVASLDALTPKH
ncbi:MAG TPA: DUF4174 domain-containing protein [Acidobacteriaceae bacterium]|nr:DUF4174 domain-containing protein [Acidobacteriaceae bacterium]